MATNSKRARLKFILSKLTDRNREIFMRMYSPDNLTDNIDSVVDMLPAPKLKWALSQAENTYHSIFRILKS